MALGFSYLESEEVFKAIFRNDLFKMKNEFFKDHSGSGLGAFQTKGDTQEGRPELGRPRSDVCREDCPLSLMVNVPSQASKPHCFFTQFDLSGPWRSGARMTAASSESGV